MRPGQKIALSLLISVVAFALFALFAFSGLFRLVESSFYDNRVRQDIASQLGQWKDAAAAYGKGYLDRFQALLQNDAVKRIYSPNQSAQDIFVRKNLFDKLLSDYPGILYVRFIDNSGNIHFSTLSSDVLRSDQYSITYKTLANADPTLPVSAQELSSSSGRPILIDAPENRILFRLPAVDALGQVRGTAIFYVAASDFASYLVRKNLIGPGKSFTPIGNLGFVLGLEPGSEAALAKQIEAIWGRAGSPAAGEPIAVDSRGQRLFLFTIASPDLGLIGELVPASVFILQPALKTLLSAAIFLTVFLLAFLLLSLRQDKLLVLADRVKRFQISFLKEYLESKSAIDWARWHAELELRRNEVRREIKRGIGSISKERAQVVDSLIDKSWDEILTVIGKRADEEPATAREVRGLEEVIRKLLTSGELMARLPGAALPESRTGRTGGERREGTAGGDAPAAVAQPVEEIAEAEEVEELEEIKESHSGASEAAVPQTPAEEVPEAEEVEELEEVEEEPAAGGPATVAAADVKAAAAEAKLAAAGEKAAALPRAPFPTEEAEEVEILEELPEAEAAATAPEAPPATGVQAAAIVEAQEPLEELPAVALEEELEEIPATDLEGRAQPPVAAAPTSAEEEELEELPEEPETVGGGPEAIEGGRFAFDEIEKVDALDLEAIFHGEELLADIDIFEESEREPGYQAGALEKPSDGEEVGSLEEVEEGGEEAAPPVSAVAQSVSEEESEEFVEYADVEEPAAVLDETGIAEELEPLQPVDEQEGVAALRSLAVGAGGAGDVEELAAVEIAVAGEAALEQISGGFSLFRAFQAREFTAPKGFGRSEPFGRLEEIGAGDGREIGERARVARGKAPESPEPAEELAELEPLEEISATGAASTLQAAPKPSGPQAGATSARTAAERAFEKRLGDLIRYKRVEIYSLSEIRSMELVPESAIEVSDGVYQVRGEVYASKSPVRDSELKSLVDSVAGVFEDAAFEPAPSLEDFAGRLSIPSVELSFEGSELRQHVENAGGIAAPRRRRAGSGLGMLSSQGFDYDGYRSEFKGGAVGVMKSLMRISQAVDAIYAAILLPAEGGLRAEYALGLDDSAVQVLRFGAGDVVFQNLLSRKALIYVRIQRTGLRELDGKISDRDLKFIQGAMYLPIIFDNKPAYLFFGLKNNSPTIQEHLLGILGLRGQG